jgi:hypothetical protein
MEKHLAILLDPCADQASTQDAAKRIDNTEDALKVLQIVANSHSYSLPHRILAIELIFEKFVIAPISLEKAAERLRSAEWLRTAKIEKTDTLGGETLIAEAPGTTVFAITFFDSQCSQEQRKGIYVRVNQVLDCESFRYSLLSAHHLPLRSPATITQISPFNQLQTAD